MAVVCAFVAVCLPRHLAQARWATEDDADSAIERIERTYDINEDGSFTSNTSILYEILKEDGRRHSNYRHVYNSRASRFKVLEAYTLNGAEKVKVESQFIEDKPQASRVTGFDDMNLVTVAFPKVAVGSKIFFRYEEDRHETAVPGHFSTRFRFGDEVLMKSAVVTFRSKSPLFFEKNDPHGQIEVKQESSGDSHVLKVNLTKPAFIRTADEPNPSINPKQQPSIVVSNFKTFAQIAEKLAPAYEAVISAQLPESFKAIVKAAAAKKRKVDQINTVTSMLAEEVRYMGDWRPVNGGQFPRPLETIAKTKFGDCKDFSVATIAMLRALGMNAYVSLVERGYRPEPYPSIGLAASFNHAIVWAEAEGKSYWIDPTNFLSFAQGIFEDIIDRQTLVLRPTLARLERIPSEAPSRAVSRRVSQIKINAKGDAHVKTKMQYKGRFAHWATGLQLKRSDEQINFSVIRSLVDENRLKSYRIGPYNLNSRVVADVELDLSHDERDYAMRTTLGPAFYLDQARVNSLLRLEVDKRVSDLFLGAPRVTELTEHVDNIRVLGTAPPSCRLETPWVSVSRTLKQIGHGFQISDKIVFRKNRILNAELKSKTFKRFQKRLQDCFDRIAVVFEPLQERTETLRKISNSDD